MTETAAVLDRLDSSWDGARSRLFDLLRIPSVSAQPAHAPDCARAAEWVRAQLSGLGFEAGLRSTPGHPIVVAHHPGPGGDVPHVLFYGHYDVQPAEPLELWDSPAFEPTFVDGPRGKRVVARGAVDDKGQVMMWIEALRAWHEAGGGLPVRATVLVEGEEEVGSENLDAFLEANAAELKADVAVISDTGMWDAATPALTTRLRGMVYAEVTVTGPVARPAFGAATAARPSTRSTPWPASSARCTTRTGGCRRRASTTGCGRSRPSCRGNGRRWASTRRRSSATSA